jgi:hypothetical protein
VVGHTRSRASYTAVRHVSTLLHRREHLRLCRLAKLSSSAPPCDLPVAIRVYAAAATQLSRRRRAAACRRLHALCASPPVEISSQGTFPSSAELVALGGAVAQAARDAGDGASSHEAALVAALLQRAGEAQTVVAQEDAAARPQELRLSVASGAAPLVLALQVCRAPPPLPWATNIVAVHRWPRCVDDRLMMRVGVADL